MAFLEKIAKRYLEEYGNDIHKIVFVFPTRRARLYFRRHLQDLKPEGVAIWAPPTYSIDDFVAQMSELTISDPMDLIFELYAIYRKHIRHYPREFADFYPWGKMIISDFDEIDKYLIDTEMLFRTLKEFKVLEDINKAEKSDIYNRYTGFWEDLGILNREFKTFLREKKRAYEGMVYRDVAENIARIIETIETDENAQRWDKIVFCGLNALTKAEETIIRYLLDTGKAEIYWDMDNYFIDDPNQEAGYFFRKNMKLPGMQDPKWVENRMLETKFINIIGVQSKVSQAKVLGIKLQELREELMDPENIAVVLPDETMLFPTLNSIPESIDQINVTIGFPLQQTPAFSLFDSLVEMQTKAAEGEGFYHKDIRKVLNHPYIKLFAPDEIDAFFDKIKKENLIYIKEVGDVETHLKSEPLRNLFNPRINSSELMEFFLEVLNNVRAFYRENKPDLLPVDYEYMYHFYTLISRLRDSLKNTGLVLSNHTFRQLFTDIVKNSRIPFTGEPLVGLQIMGMLETQTLDFNHTIVLSVNEGYLPPGKGGQSFIPFEVRITMGMPTYKERDAIAAYHFYRLLKNSRHITLIYVTESKAIEKSEKSRFIEQLLIEYAERNKNAKILHKIIDFSFDTGSVKEVTIRKTEQILDLLWQKRYSATSLINYLSCSLKFYFTYILKLQEEEEVYESPDYSQIGTIIHETLKKLYEIHSGTDKPLLVNDIEEIKKKIDETLKESYHETLKTGDIETGRNRIAYEVMRKFLENFFEKEKQRKGFRIEMLEKKIEAIDFLFPLKGETQHVLLEGTIDRLDKDSDGVYCIIDYKTGKTGSINLNSEDFIMQLSGQEAVNRKEVFQLLFYRYLLKREGKYEGAYRLGIYPFKKMYDELVYVKADKVDIIEPGYVDGIEEVLKRIFQELFDSEIPFAQTKEEKNCRLCPYVGICSKKIDEYIY